MSAAVGTRQGGAAGPDPGCRAGAPVIIDEPGGGKGGEDALTVGRRAATGARMRPRRSVAAVPPLTQLRARGAMAGGVDLVVVRGGTARFRPSSVRPRPPDLAHRYPFHGVAGGRTVSGSAMGWCWS